MTLVAIDTSVLIGLIDARDVWHRAALQLQAALRAARLTPVHFECTVTEALSTRHGGCGNNVACRNSPNSLPVW